MKRSWDGFIVSAPILVALSLLFCVVPTASAGIFETHHDLKWMTGRSEEDRSPCSRCHIPGRLFSERGPFAGERVAGYSPTIDRLGSFCFACHDGTVNPDGLIEAQDGTIGVAVLTETHGYDVQRIMEATGGLETWRNVDSSGLVPPDPTSDMLPANFSCSACHDVHSDRYAPFLQVPLEELCTKCHSGSDGLGRGRWTALQDAKEENGPHPVGMAVAESLSDLVRGTAAEKSFHGPDAIFAVPNPSVEELRDPTRHWTMGGHLLGLGQDLVSCSTCHSAHLPQENLLVAHVSDDFQKTVCSACHTDGEARDNPGVTPNGHPVFESSAPPYEHDHARHAQTNHPNIPDSGILELFVQIPDGLPIAEGGELLCLTCHRAHQGAGGGRCRREGPQKGPVLCNECHGTGSYITTFNWHHPVDPSDFTVIGFPNFLPWNEGPGLPGDLSDGLQCVDCHSGLAKSAHNW